MSDLPQSPRRTLARPSPGAVDALLDVAGAVYLPFLVANRAALASGADRVRIEAHALAYEGAPFKYQGR